MPSSVYIVRSLKLGRSGWLLRWCDRRRPDDPTPRKLSHWFDDAHAAEAVRDAMRAGATFDGAYCLLWDALHKKNP